MDLKLNVQKRGLSTTAETINEEFTLHYGHIFRGEDGASIVVDTELSETSNNAIANSTVTVALGGMATKEELEVVQEETKENGKTLEYLIKSETKDFVPTIAYEDSEIINGQVSAYNGYRVSAPIFLNKGETISLTSYSGGGTQAISLTDANGTFYTSIDNTPGYKTRTYTAIKDCYVALSWANNESTYPMTLTITRIAIIPDILHKLEALATPSGDPMHYAYESAGAVWNGESWSLAGGIGFSSKELSYAFFNGNSRIYPNSNLDGFLTGGVVNFPRINMLLDNQYRSISIANIAANNGSLRYVQLTNYDWLDTFVNEMAYAFYRCTSLKRIGDILNVSNAAIHYAFDGCACLEYVRLTGLNKDISFADSPLLSKESLLYMINNCASGVSFTITLHPDVFEKCADEWLEDIDRALGVADIQKQTNITLASA